MKKSKQEKSACIKKLLIIFGCTVAILATICIGVPFLINWILYWDIKTNNSTDGDWLSFWGSFLGGIFGGLATLVAVLVTREMAKKDNKELKESISSERKPKIIPIKKKSWMYKTYGKPNMFNDIQELEKIPRYSDNINVKIVNVGKEAAIEIEILWEKPKNILKNEYLTDMDIKVCKSFLNKFDKTKNIKVEKEYINSLEEVEIGLNSYTDIYIRELASELIDEFRKESEAPYIRYHIQVGTIYVKGTNIYNESFKMFYDMEMSIIEVDRSDELYSIIIEFKSIKDRK